jgi:multidrug efflux system outer membrane protein
MGPAVMNRARNLLIMVAFGVLGALCAPSAAAADAAPVAVVLEDEESLVRFALAHNPELSVSRSDQDLADAEISSASALSNPQLRAEWLHVQSFAEKGFGIGLEWSPPQPGVYGSRQDAARAQARAVTEDLRELAANVEAQVRGAYARVQALDQEITLADESVATRRTLHDVLKERVARGAATRIDLGLVAISLARGVQERELLLLSRARAKAELEALLGMPPEQSLLLKTSAVTAEAIPASPEPVDRAPRADAELVQTALSARPQLRADSARTEAADRTLSVERAKRYPWLELQARYRRHDQSNYPHDLTLGVAITLPILSQNHGPIAAAEAQRRKQRELAAAHRAEIERNVHALRAESAQLAQVAEHYQAEIAPVLREHSLLVKQALAGLELDLSAVLSAEDMVTRGRIEYVEARLAQHQATIALQRALGAYGRARPRGQP